MNDRIFIILYKVEQQEIRSRSRERELLGVCTPVNESGYSVVERAMKKTRQLSGLIYKQ